MTHVVRRWRTLLRVLAVALIVAAIPLPSSAQQAGQQAAKPRLQASIAPIVHSVVSASATTLKKQDQSRQDPKAKLGSTSFFRTGPGLAVLAIVVGGTAYAIYSASHDRIHSTVPANLQ